MSYLKLVRAHQWLKNSFIFLPIFFAGKLDDMDLLLQTLVVAAAFCLVASSIYILNDWRDIEDDRKHPTKKNRPLASGAVSPTNALVLMFALAIGGSLTIFFIEPMSFYFTAGYIVMNLLYSFGLKHIPIVDISIISIGFVLRLLVGSYVDEAKVPLSMWAILITYLLALFLALAKRRDDVLLAAEGNKVRKSIDGYNLEFINGGMMIMASVTLVAYIMYTISPEVTGRFHSHNLFMTVFWVILGILRYMQITFVEGRSGSPTKVLIKDLFLQLVILGWIGNFVVIIYF